MNATPEPLRRPAAPPAPEPSPSRLRLITRRKTFWIILLAIGYWFATPYYFPWTADDEMNADSRAIAAQGSIDRELAMPALALLAAYMLWRSRPLPKMRGYLLRGAVLFLLVNAASIAWSVDPAVSVRRYGVFLMDVLLIVAIARVYSVLDLARIGFFVGGFAAVFAFCIDVFVTRSFAPFDPNYRLMGIMSSNSMGENLTVCIFCGLALLLNDRKRGRWLIPGLLAAAALLFFTRSRTASISCLLFSSFFLKRIAEARYRIQVRLLGALLVFGMAASFVIAKGDLVQVLQNGFMMGRNDTQNTASLSNRLPLWQELSGYVAGKPLFGYGFRAFWTSDHISIISEHQKWAVPNAHDTYLDEYLSTGILGAPLYIFVFWGALFIAWRRYLKVPIPERLLPAVLLSWLFFTSWVESVPLDPFLPTTLAYVCLLKSMLPAPLAALPATVARPLRPLARRKRPSLSTAPSPPPAPVSL